MTNSTTFRVYGSHGVLTVDRSTGNVLTYDQQGMNTNEYADITRFDLSDWPRARDVPNDIDILCLGFWCGENSQYQKAQLFIDGEKVR